MHKRTLSELPPESKIFQNMTRQAALIRENEQLRARAQLLQQQLLQTEEGKKLLENIGPLELKGGGS